MKTNILDVLNFIKLMKNLILELKYIKSKKIFLLTIKE